jgi:hypothetical protein
VPGNPKETFRRTGLADQHDFGTGDVCWFDTTALTGTDKLPPDGDDRFAHKAQFWFGNIVVELIAYVTFGQRVLPAYAGRDDVLGLSKGQAGTVAVIDAVTQGAQQ